MTHTPGPWVAGHFDDISDEIVIQTHEGEYVASIDCDGAYEGKIAKCIDANARLIAAAPDLLAALINLYGIAVDEGIVGDNTTLEAARAAIAKAKGRGMMFDTSNAFAVRGTTIPPLLWDTFQEAVAQDMQARARKEGHMARMPSINPDKPPPKPHSAMREIIKAGKSVTKVREKRYTAILAAMTEKDMTAVQIVDNMGGNHSARSIAESLRYIAERGQVKITKSARKDIPHTYTRIK